MSGDWTTVGIPRHAKEVFDEQAIPGYPKGKQLGALIVHWYNDDRGRRDVIPRELRAMKRLKESGVSPQLIANAFGCHAETVIGLESVSIDTLDDDGGDG